VDQKNDDAPTSTKSMVKPFGMFVAFAVLTTSTFSLWNIAASSRLAQPDVLGGVYSSDQDPVSLMNPVKDLGILPFDRLIGNPGKVWGSMLTVIK
jgi:hypothetical protein